MIPVKFDYAAPTTVEDAVRALAEAGDEGKIIGGGQSLLPVLRMRMADPETLVDLGRVEGLRGVRLENQEIVVGATTTHHAVAQDPVLREHLPLLCEAAATIGDAQVRYRGTIGGSLAHADPAGDMGPAVLALDGVLDLAGPDGRRQVGASEFFQDHFTTALADDEIVVAVRFSQRPGWSMHYEKFTQVAQSWAIVSSAVAVRLDGDHIAEARVALGNMGSTPLRSAAAEAALVGCDADDDAVRAASEHAGDGTEPPTDLAGTPEYRRHLAGVLTARAVRAAIG